MDVASSAISNVVNTSFPHAAQEARRDALAKETIPQLNQSANSNPNNAVAQGRSQTNPAQSSLFIQAETIIKTHICCSNSNDAVVGTRGIRCVRRNESH